MKVSLIMTPIILILGISPIFSLLNKGVKYSLKKLSEIQDLGSLKEDINKELAIIPKK